MGRQRRTFQDGISIACEDKWTDIDVVAMDLERQHHQLIADICFCQGTHTKQEIHTI